jgi:hypothetical protein
MVPMRNGLAVPTFALMSQLVFAQKTYMTKKMKVTMTEHYNIMNQDLKNLCEQKT